LRALQLLLAGTAFTMPALRPTLVPILAIVWQPLAACDADFANAPVLANVSEAAAAAVATSTRATRRLRLLSDLVIRVLRDQVGAPGHVGAALT
jgi:hypothetical protein